MTPVFVTNSTGLLLNHDKIASLIEGKKHEFNLNDINTAYQNATVHYRDDSFQVSPRLVVISKVINYGYNRATEIQLLLKRLGDTNSVLFEAFTVWYRNDKTRQRFVNCVINSLNEHVAEVHHKN